MNYLKNKNVFLLNILKELEMNSLQKKMKERTLNFRYNQRYVLNIYVRFLISISRSYIPVDSHQLHIFKYNNA